MWSVGKSTTTFNGADQSPLATVTEGRDTIRAGGGASWPTCRIIDSPGERATSPCSNRARCCPTGVRRPRGQCQPAPSQTLADIHDTSSNSSPRPRLPCSRSCIFIALPLHKRDTMVPCLLSSFAKSRYRTIMSPLIAKQYPTEFRTLASMKTCLHQIAFNTLRDSIYDCLVDLVSSGC